MTTIDGKKRAKNRLLSRLSSETHFLRLYDLEGLQKISLGFLVQPSPVALGLGIVFAYEFLG